MAKTVDKLILFNYFKSRDVAQRRQYDLMKLYTNHGMLELQTFTSSDYVKCSPVENCFKLSSKLIQRNRWQAEGDHNALHFNNNTEKFNIWWTQFYMTTAWQQIISQAGVQMVDASGSSKMNNGENAFTESTFTFHRVHNLSKHISMFPHQLLWWICSKS